MEGFKKDKRVPSELLSPFPVLKMQATSRRVVAACNHNHQQIRSQLVAGIFRVLHVSDCIHSLSVQRQCLGVLLIRKQAICLLFELLGVFHLFKDCHLMNFLVPYDLYRRW